MRTRVVVGGVLVSVGILTAGIESAVAHGAAPTSALGTTGTSGSTSSGSAGGAAASSATGTSGSNPAPSSAASAGTSSGAGSSTGPKDGTYTGSTVRTPFGDVQVRVTISGGKITAIDPLQMTDLGGYSVQLDAQAVPMLKQEAMSAQSANINAVSGATYTSQGYAQSLQSALDQAK